MYDLELGSFAGLEYPSWNLSGSTQFSRLADWQTGRLAHRADSSFRVLYMAEVSTYIRYIPYISEGMRYAFPLLV